MTSLYYWILTLFIPVSSDSTMFVLAFLIDQEFLYQNSTKVKKLENKLKRTMIQKLIIRKTT